MEIQGSGDRDMEIITEVNGIAAELAKRVRESRWFGIFSGINLARHRGRILLRGAGPEQLKTSENLSGNGGAGRKKIGRKGQKKGQKGDGFVMMKIGFAGRRLVYGFGEEIVEMSPR